MKKEIIIGVAAVATVGAIGVGAFLMSSQGNDLRQGNDKNSTVSEEDRKKIEDLTWDEWSNVSKYGFCLGEAKINTAYSDPILNGAGMVDHNSKEVLLLDKEKNRIYIITREINFKYKGSIDVKMGDLSVHVPVSESGNLSETYNRNEMPVRIDFASNYITTNPDTKKTNWVYSVIDEETEMVMPRTGCAGIYKLDNSMGKDLLIGNEQIIIERECNEHDVSGNYEGNFDFSCSAIDHKHARELFDLVREKEELKKYIDSNGENTEVDTATDGSLRSTEDIKKALEQMKQEMNASQTIK
jgi:hypothetical protein